MTPVGLVMAGCWQINSILANIGRRKSIRILNQYSFFWIWAQLIMFYKAFCIKKKLLELAAGDQWRDQRLARTMGW